MGMKWEDYKKEKLENNPDLKREYEKLKSRVMEKIIKSKFYIIFYL
jgi:hypothetical protein